MTQPSAADAADSSMPDAPDVPGGAESPGGAENSEPVTIRDAEDRSRFEILVGTTLAGFTEYVDGTGDEDGQRTFPHTVVDEAFGGRGLSKLLIRTALDAARVSDLAVIPACSAVQRFLAKNPEYADLVPQARRSEFEL